MRTYKFEISAGDQEAYFERFTGIILTAEECSTAYLGKKWNAGNFKIEFKSDRRLSEIIAAMEDEGMDEDLPEAEAKLFAAAPEYDELLGEAIDIFEGDLTGVEWKRAWRDFTHRAKALRAKARGEQ